MIQDIPTSEDFINAGKAQFDFSWDIVVSFLKIFDEAGDYGVDVDEDGDEFWEAAKQRIQTALAITQQGVELILKGKIVSVSPYLLISGSPSDWPNPSINNNLDFSNFRTIDAQDLIKTHNLFSDDKLNDEFVTEFDSLRKLRNRVLHTVDKNLKVSAIEVITKILEMHNHLIPDENWVETRHEFLSESAESQLFSSDGVEAQLAWEFYIVFSILKPAQVNKFFGINKKQRKYICPKCKYDSADYTMVEPKYAVLRPNRSDSAGLYCFVCGETHPVTRTDCDDEECKGNVISDEYGECCTCGKTQG